MISIVIWDASRWMTNSFDKGHSKGWKKKRMHSFHIDELTDVNYCSLSLWLTKGETNIIPHTLGARAILAINVINDVLQSPSTWGESFLWCHSGGIKILFKLQAALFSRFAKLLMNIFRFCEISVWRISNTIDLGNALSLTYYFNWKYIDIQNQIHHCFFNYIFSVVKIWMSAHMNDSRYLLATAHPTPHFLCNNSDSCRHQHVLVDWLCLMYMENCVIFNIPLSHSRLFQKLVIMVLFISPSNRPFKPYIVHRQGLLTVVVFRLIESA